MSLFQNLLKPPAPEITGDIREIVRIQIPLEIQSEVSGSYGEIPHLHLWTLP
jgi:hypothetical protein